MSWAPNGEAFSISSPRSVIPPNHTHTYLHLSSHNHHHHHHYHHHPCAARCRPRIAAPTRALQPVCANGNDDIARVHRYAGDAAVCLAPRIESTEAPSHNR